MSQLTVAELKTCSMRMTRCIDGSDWYQNHYKCVEFPEFVRVEEGPRRPPWRTPMGSKSASAKHKGITDHVVRFFVHGNEVPTTAQAIVDAINAFRAAVKAGPTDPPPAGPNKDTA